MTISTLDPKTALIVIDLQKRRRRLSTAHPSDGIVRNARALADAFRPAHGLSWSCWLTPLAAPPGERSSLGYGPFADGWADIVPELNQQVTDHVVTKRTWGAFTNTGLEQHLKTLGVTQYVVAGIATSIGVELTARYARECGFNVSLAIDAMTDMNGDAHINSVTRIFPRLGETGTTQEIIDLLDGVRAVKCHASVIMHYRCISC